MAGTPPQSVEGPLKGQVQPTHEHMTGEREMTSYDHIG